MFWITILSVISTIPLLVISSFHIHKREAECTLPYNDEAIAKSWVTTYNDEAVKKYHNKITAEWNFLTNLTKENEKKFQEESIAYANWSKAPKKIAKQFVKCNSGYDDDIKRQLMLISLSSNPKEPKKLKRMSELAAKLQGIYGNAVVHRNGKRLTMLPDLHNIMANSRDPTELLWAWRSWHSATGPQMRSIYTEFVQLQNDGARENGFSDMGEFWRFENYEMKELNSIVDDLWTKMKPLYEQLHAYVRRKLINKYTQLHISPTGAIPAHLLGNMWAQEWVNILDLVTPYPDTPTADVTPEMVKQKYTPLGMFKKAEEFFESTGFEPMTKEFWEHSVIEKPNDRKIECHGSAEDFHDKHDFRIKMCTTVTLEDLETVHHEMGHIQYYMQYRHQPFIYQGGANAAFHEAVGDTITLSVVTPHHLQALGLLKEEKESRESEINFLMKQALTKVAFLPFGLLIDKWRWDVFSGKTTKQNYNHRWWQLRFNYQGIKPPVKRSEKDFDPGAKYHVPANVPYIRYFLSFIGQFQFHKSMCDAMGFKGPLHHCDIYKSCAAGDKLRAMLKLGKSKPWSQAMRILTGQPSFNTDAILSYFKPLHEWLKEQNAEEFIGWKDH